MEQGSSGDLRENQTRKQDNGRQSQEATSTSKSQRPQSTERPQSIESPQSIERMSGNFSPSRWTSHPFETLTRMSREMDQLIESFFGGRFGFPSRERSGVASLSDVWTPRIDVRQRGDDILICAELPGVRKDQVEIEATNEGIAISGERREEREQSDDRRGYRFAERSYGSFYRNIPLPEGAQVENARATMRDGVLEVTVPLGKASQRRRIQISE